MRNKCDNGELKKVIIKCLGSLLTRNAYFTMKIKTTITMAKEAFTRKISLLTRKINIELSKKLFRCYIWSREKKEKNTAP